MYTDMYFDTELMRLSAFENRDNFIQEFSVSSYPIRIFDENI